MKFLVFKHNDYTKIRLSDNLKEILDKKVFPKNRTGEIIDYIEKHAQFINLDEKYNEKEIADYIRNLEKGIFEILKFKENEEIRYLLYDKKNENIVYFNIIDIDISKPWTLVIQDNCEKAEYLKYNIFDKELNFCKIEE